MSNLDDISDFSEYSDDEQKSEELRELRELLDREKRKAGSQPVEASSSGTCAFNEELQKIQNAIQLNRHTEEKLRRLETALITRLRECRQRLKEIQTHSRNLNQKSDKHLVFRYVYCGKPYFRDRTNFPPPDNEDTITMEKSGMYDFSEVTAVSGWTVKDKSELQKQILEMSRKIKIAELETQIAALKRKSKQRDSKACQKQIQKEILAIKKEITAVSKKKLNEDIVLPLDQEYDWEVIANALNNRHSPEEYRSLWKLFLHPSINKKSWEKAEHSKLNEIIQENHLQDWEKIAAQLGTGRTSYQCFVYYRTNMGTALTVQKWTKEEEEYLKRLIDYYREDGYIPWGKVAASMENRTKIQVYNKYLRILEVRKGRFLPEEDTVLLTSVKKFGEDFKKIMKYLPGRSCSQLRTRYQTLKNTTHTSTVWTVEEDKKLLQLMANQDPSQYINYSAIQGFFPGKNRINLRARYITLVKWMKRHPSKDISRAPRRGARRLAHGKGENDLSIALESLKNRIKSEVEIKKSRRINKDSTEDDIDHAIVTALINENIHEMNSKKQNDQRDDLSNQHDHVVPCGSNETNLRKVLILLKASLNKDKFQSSLYAAQYPNITQPDALTRSVKVKSYSKKKAIDVIQGNALNNPTDIWGNNKLKTCSYVLPPNYSTITACRRLMSYTSGKPIHNNRSLSMQQYTRRNVLLKEQLDLFMERFKTLFLWPILLSNESPAKQNASNSTNVQKNIIKRREVLAPCVTSIVIPSKTYNTVNDCINLDSTNKVRTVVKPLVGCDDFMYIEEEEEDDSVL